MVKKLFRKLALGPAAIISMMIVALLSLLGLISFTPPTLDESSEDVQQEQAIEETTDSSSLVTIESPLQPNTVAEETKKRELPSVVDVLIDGDEYWINVGQSDDTEVREKRTALEVMRACEECEGDASGVRIRVTRTFNATAQAEQALRDALADSGLSDDEIDFRRTLVERPELPQ